MTAPRLAFVVATKDRPAELARLWRSLVAQTVPPAEVVIVEAGAGPSPLEPPPAGGPVLRRIASPVASATRQRNLGLDAVGPEADLVGFLDDDAVLEPDAVAEMLRFFAAFGPELGGAAFNMTNHPPMDLAAVKRTPFAESLGLYARRGGAVTRSGFQTMIGAVEATVWTDWLPSGAVVWRREILRSQRFDEWYAGYSYLEDLDFSYRVGRAFRLAVVASARYRHEPAPGGRRSAFAFGLREVLNRVRFVRKYPDLSLARCRAALGARMLMSAAWAAKELEPAHLARAFGNAVGLVRSFERAGEDRRAWPTVLVYGQVPPPHNGSNVMTREFLAAVRKSGREPVLSRKSLSGRVDDVNRIRPVKAFRLAATWARLAATLRRAKPDLAVVFASSTLIGLAAESVVAALCRLHRVPYAVYLHTDVHRRLPGAPFPLRPVLRSVFRSAAATLVLGGAFKAELAAQGLERVFVLPNCVDGPAAVNGDRPRDGRARVLFLSNIEESKGVLTLLRSVPLVLAEAPGAMFTIAGPWRGRAIRREVEALLAASVPAGSVVLAGEAYGERKAELLAGHDVFVLPSRREAQSLAVLEAMAAGLPVVATSVGAMADMVVDGTTGFLVPPDDPEALARRLAELVRDDGIRTSMGRSGRRVYEQLFTPAVYEKNVADILDRIMAGGAGA